MFIWDETSLYVMRFLLGVTEAGFFPGALFYLAQWFPSARRTRMTATFFIGVPISGIIGSAVSGLDHEQLRRGRGSGRLAVVVLIEGIPPILLAGAVWFCLVDRPADAKWLTDEEKATVEADLADD
nr:MFS transporter [Rhodococcus opacus]